MLLLLLGPSPYCLYCSYRSHSCQPGASATTSPVPACITCGGTRIEFIEADAELGPKASVQPPNSPTPCCHPTVPPMQSPTLPPTSLYSASSISTATVTIPVTHRKGVGKAGGLHGRAVRGAVRVRPRPGPWLPRRSARRLRMEGRRTHFVPSAAAASLHQRQGRPKVKLEETEASSQLPPVMLSLPLTCGGASGNHFLGLKPPPPPPPPSSERLPLRSRCRRERSFPSRERDLLRRSRDLGGEV